MITFDEAIQKIRELPVYHIKIGVFDGQADRDEDDKDEKGNPKTHSEKPNEEYTVGINNAQLMFIHENGSPLRNIPARPVLNMTLEWANKNGVTLGAQSRAIRAYITSNFDISKLEDELNRFCMRLEDYAKDIIYSNDGRLAPNAESTIRRKRLHVNHPLFDTGQLARSITCRLVRADGTGKE